MRHNISHYLHKIFSKFTLSYLLVFATILNSVAPALMIVPSAYAVASVTSNVGFVSGSHSFAVSLSDSHASTPFQIYYKTPDNIENANGNVDGTTPTLVYAGTESEGIFTPHIVYRGILKVDIDGTFHSTYFTMDGDTLTIVDTQTTPSLVLTTEENDWLLAPVFTKVVRHTDLANSFADIFLNADAVADTDHWFFYNDESDAIDTTMGSFITGPDTTPLSDGSIQISVSGSQRRNIATYQFSGIPLSDITVLSFNTYNPSAGNGGSANRTGYLNFNVDFNGSDTWQRRLIFSPPSGEVLQNTWQEWDAIQSGSALWHYSGSTWPVTGQLGSTSKTWSQILSDYPSARVRVTDSWMGVRVGSPYADGYTENIDAFKFGTDKDGIKVFDFEPAYVDSIPPAKPTGLKRVTPDSLTTYQCGDIVQRQTLYPTWNDMSVGDPSFDHYDYVSFTPSGAIGTTQTLYTNQFVHAWVPTSDGTNGYAVRSVDASGNISDWSLTGKTLAGSCQITYDSTAPLAPTLTSPVDGAYVSGNPVETWTSIAGTHHYVYQSATNPDFSPVAYTTNVPTNQRTVGGNQTIGFWWRVKAVDAADNESGWSEIRKLNVDNTIPSVPVLTWPIDGISTNDNSPLMQWDDSNDVLGVAGYLYRVYYQCSNPSDFATCTQVYPTTLGLWLTASQYQAGTTADGVYYWQVRAQDNAGNQSAWSEEEKVTIDTSAPTTPSLNSPIDGYVTKGVAFDQKWYSISDAVLYEYQSCSTDPGDLSGTCSSVKYSNTYTGTTKNVGAGQPNSHFWWRVRAKDIAGNWSSWSESRELIIDNTAPVLSSKTSFPNPWYVSGQTSIFTYTDNESSITSGNNPSCDLTTEGEDQTCTVTPNVCDAAGNCNTTNVTSDTADLDFTAPTSTITSPLNTATNQTVITNSWDGNIEGSAQDAISGLSQIDLSMERSSDGDYWDGANWVSGTESTVRVTATGTTTWTYSLPTPTEDTYTITSHAIDLAGNIENSYTLTIIFDKTIPEVAITLNPATPDASNGWYKTQPEMTLTATDTNIDRIEYQWDTQSGSWTTYSAPFKPASEGAHILYYRAHDLADNYSGVGIKNIKWDQTELTKGPENISVSPNPTSSDKSTVTWEPASDNTGIDRYEVQWKLGDKIYTDSVGQDIRKHELNNLTEGVWTVIVRAFDSAGNSKEGSVSLTVDRTPPSAPSLSLTGTAAGSVSLGWNAVAGADKYLIWYGTTPGTYLYGANVGNVTSYTVQGLGAGTYYFIVRAHDASGNGSGNSNEVSTGTIAGATGVVEGAPATEFSENPAVLGEQTTASDTVDPVGETGSVLGSTVSRLWWLWFIPVVLLLIYYLSRRRHIR